MAAYKGIKAGNPQALVAAGETSNRGHNSADRRAQRLARAGDVRPARLGRRTPKLPFDAWATHPYPSVYALGPAQKVAYPNVALSTMSKFGASLEQWFHRRVPIWVTEYGEQTKPEYPTGGVSYAQQAAHAKMALQDGRGRARTSRCSSGSSSATAPPRRGSAASRQANGTKKPAYAAFAKQAAQDRRPDAVRRARQDVPGHARRPVMTYYDAPGAVVGVTYRVSTGRRVVASVSRARRSRANQYDHVHGQLRPGEGQELHDDRARERQARPDRQQRRHPAAHERTTGTTTTSKTTTSTTTTTKE